MPTRETTNDTDKYPVVQPPAPSIDELIQAQQTALANLLQQKAEEEARKRAEEYANMTPEQRILSQVQLVLDHMDAQIVKLGGHSYKIYNL